VALEADGRTRWPTGARTSHSSARCASRVVPPLDEGDGDTARRGELSQRQRQCQAAILTASMSRNREVGTLEVASMRSFTSRSTTALVSSGRRGRCRSRGRADEDRSCPRCDGRPWLQVRIGRTTEARRHALELCEEAVVRVHDALGSEVVPDVKVSRKGSSARPCSTVTSGPRSLPTRPRFAHRLVPVTHDDHGFDLAYRRHVVEPGGEVGANDPSGRTYAEAHPVEDPVRVQGP